VDFLQDILISRATGGRGSNRNYQLLRDELRTDPEIRRRLPRYLASAEDLSEFWSYIQEQDGTYQGRREHISGSFDRVLRYLADKPAASRPRTARRVANPPIDGNVRAFISYSNADREAAATVKRTLGTFGIECFLAHEDIRVSQEWKDRILEELAACQVFIVLLSAAFRASDWGPQEIGAVAHRKGVAIVPLTLDGTPPFGFITHIQGKQVPASGLEPDAILDPLVQKFPRAIIPRMIERVRSSQTFRTAEATMRPIVPHLGRLDDDELRDLVQASIENPQVWAAKQCRYEYLPRLISTNRKRINAKQLRALEYQVQTGSWYEGK
jgi:hypothetical protein